MEVLYLRCCGLDVHKETVVACLRVVSGGPCAVVVSAHVSVSAMAATCESTIAGAGVMPAGIQVTSRSYSRSHPTSFWRPAVCGSVADGCCRCPAGIFHRSADAAVKFFLTVKIATTLAVP